MIAEFNIGDTLYSATLYLAIAGVGYLAFRFIDHVATMIKEPTDDR